MYPSTLILQDAAYLHGGFMPFSSFRSASIHQVGRMSVARSGFRLYGTVGMCLAILLMSSPGWSETVQAPDIAKPTIVAAGFGYQIGDISTITVKVYEAATGEVLSDDTFELDVKEERSRSHPGQARIFAGGVGLGTTDLSHFVLRVYDARTGQFQWEGQLNLSPRDGSDSGQVVSTVVPRRASFIRIASAETALRQPSFLLRALDSETGSLVWEHEFSTESGRSAWMERITDGLAHNTQSPDLARTFDLSIRMSDANGEVTLWEDQISQEEPDQATRDAVDDYPHVLPGWPQDMELQPPAQFI
jgi:hypothetical protein